VHDPPIRPSCPKGSLLSLLLMRAFFPLARFPSPLLGGNSSQPSLFPANFLTPFSPGGSWVCSPLRIKPNHATVVEIGPFFKCTSPGCVNFHSFARPPLENQDACSFLLPLPPLLHSFYPSPLFSPSTPSLPLSFPSLPRCNYLDVLSQPFFLFRELCMSRTSVLDLPGRITNPSPLRRPRSSFLFLDSGAGNPPPVIFASTLNRVPLLPLHETSRTAGQSTTFSFGAPPLRPSFFFSPQ